MPKNDLLKTDDFTIWQPGVVEILKSEGDESSEESRRIGGYCSTEHLDRQDEKVLQRGLDFREFIDYGYFNDNHNQSTTALVGVPESAEFHAGKGWYTTGHLLKGFPRADELWTLAKSLEGTRRKLGFSIEGKVLERRGNHIVKAKIRNVAVTNCFPGTVQAIGNVEHLSRRQYDGPLVEIELATGEKLSGTPNHPVLTQRGWVPMGKLKEGFDRVGRHARDAVSGTAATSSVTDDVQNVPPTLEQLFHLARLTGSSMRSRSTQQGDFHGDVLVDGKVDVVAVEGSLLHDMRTAFSKQFGERVLPASDLGETLLLGESLGAHLLRTGTRAASSLLSSLREVRTFLGSAALVPSLQGLPNGAGYTGLFGDAVNHLSAYAEAETDAGRALSPHVGFSNLVSLRVVQFSGHVFNLQASDRWYNANGVVVHNCPVNPNCSWTILAKSFDGEVVERALTAGSAVSPTSGGGVLVPEDLEHDEVKQVWRCDHKGCSKAFRSKKGFEEHKTTHKSLQVGAPEIFTRKVQSLSKSQAVEVLRRLRPNYSEGACKRIFDFAVRGE
jgi:hypothetical protein